MKRWSSNGRALWSWCICGGLLSGLDQEFDLCFGSLLRWHSLLSWSSQLEPWALIVLGGQKWSERLRVCHLRVHGALSLNAWSWGSVGIFATSLGFVRCFHKSFHSLEAIYFLAISKPKGKKKNIFAAHFEVWKSFHNHFEVWKIISQSKGHFHSKGEFRSSWRK